MTSVRSASLYGVLAALLSLGLVACNDDATGPDRFEAPQQPQNLQVNVVGQDDLAVTWTSQAGPSTAHRVELHSKTEPTRTRELVGTESPESHGAKLSDPEASELASESVTATFRDLTPGVTYTVVVFAENSVDAVASAQERVTIPETGTESTINR